MPSKNDRQTWGQERSVSVLEHRDGYPSEWAAITAVIKSRLGMYAETPRHMIRQRQGRRRAA